MVNLLLIEGEDKSHYVWIKDFNGLLSFGTKTHLFCPYCCHGYDTRYNAKKKLVDHMSVCREFGGQRTFMPKKGKNIIKFKDYHKSLKLPVVIYADFETINDKAHGCEPNPQNNETDNSSWTKIKTKHKCSGYSYTVISPYFPSRTETYRGEDAGEKFLKVILEEEKSILKWMKENEKELNLSKEEQLEFQQADHCHICKEKFINKSAPDHSHHLKQIKELLEANKLSLLKIPSIPQVKRQRRLLSLSMHPDKVGPEREEEYKSFLNKNDELTNYLITNEVIVNEKEEFEPEDDYSEEELERIQKLGWKVRDHDHWSGEFRGAAHNGCNIAYRKVQKVPVFFHNLSGYDGHIIFQNIGKVKCKDPKPIAKSMEKYIGFEIGNLQFKDSLQHLSASLDKLVNNLADKANIQGCLHCPYRGIKKDVEKHMKARHRKEFEPIYEHKIKNPTLEALFRNLYARFQTKWKHLPEEAFELLTRKGIYPYSYMNSFDKFKETSLPPKESFYNDLSRKHISDKDFEYVKKIWTTFELQSLGELHDLYMETDTLQLADIFENFRDGILKNYELDPAHFYTAPALSWSAGLKYTKVQLELPRDPDMHMFFDKGLRGGISMVANHFARANNPEMKEHWDPKQLQQSVWLGYVPILTHWGFLMGVETRTR